MKRRQARETSQLHILSLKPHNIFPGLPSHYNIKTTEPRVTIVSSSVQIEKKDDRILADLNTKQSIFTEDCGDNTEYLTWLKDWVMQAQVSEISGDDAAVTYYVTGYIGRPISRRRKCTACKDLLIDPKNIPSIGDVSEVKDLRLAMADCDGLSAPKQYCFAICALGVQIYSQLSSNESIQQQFLCLNNQQVAFVSVLTEVVKQNTDQHEFLLNQTCNEGHCNFKAI